jgi:uncharacterized protein
LALENLHSQIDRIVTRRISLGVTGFARAGKTVFLGAATHALLTADAWAARRGQGPLAGFGPFERRQLRSVRIRDDINTALPQFPFRRVRDSLVGTSAHWPDPTEGTSRLVLELNIEPSKGIERWLSKRHIGRFDHLQIELVDYPGEWLIDLPMLEQSYEDWSASMLKLASSAARVDLSEDYLKLVRSLDVVGAVDEEIVSSLSDGWAQYLFRAAAAGLTLNQPGRMLRPDTFKNSPILRFAPIPTVITAPTLHKYMSARFDQYKKQVIAPFYRDYFARIDRQIVLLDVVRALEQGREVFLEMERALEQTLRSFNYSKGGVLARLLGSRTSKVLFAATKADHVTRGDRANLENMLRGMLARVDESLPGKAERVGVMALASIRATEDYTTDQPPKREILRGKPAGAEEIGQWDPGGLPLDMPPDWEKIYFQFLRFEPPVTKNALLEGFPAINLGKALNFLIGEEIP